MQALMEKALTSAELEVTDEQRQQLIQFAQVLKDSPRKSVASWPSDEEGIQRHFLDAFFTYPKTSPETLVDVGSGAGLPGVVFSILLPKTKVFFIDSGEKRLEFIKSTVESILPGKEHGFLLGRAELLGKEAEYRETFNFVTARALAPWLEFLELTLPFVKIGGVLQGLRGKKDESPIEGEAKLFEALGIEWLSRQHYSLGQELEIRWEFLLKKKNTLPKALPRKMNQIKNASLFKFLNKKRA